VPDAEVHFLVRKAFLPVVEHNPYIDKKIVFGTTRRELLKVLRAGHYDYVIDLHHNFRTAMLKRRLGLRGRAYSFRKLNFEKWLLVNFKVNRMPGLHVVDRYLETLRDFGVKYDGQGLDYFLPEKVKLPFTLPGEYIAFVIGAKHRTKTLPPERVARVVEKLRLPAVLIGGPGDRRAGEEVIASLEGAGLTTMPVNACGQLGIHQSALVVRDAQTVISNDTGMMHVASAFSKRIVTVWGNTVPAFGMSPFLEKGLEIRMEVEGLRCRPCSKIGFAECPKGHFRCMLDQDTDAIAEAANVA
jgi:ADP-heptose:LPS heptosyltransferase